MLARDDMLFVGKQLACSNKLTVLQVGLRLEREECNAVRCNQQETLSLASSVPPSY
jgi:hypothetical protein